MIGLLRVAEMMGVIFQKNNKRKVHDPNTADRNNGGKDAAPSTFLGMEGGYLIEARRDLIPETCAAQSS